MDFIIPKKIHYCWFGHKPLPPLAIKCINSWKKYFPDYEIIEWNEDNFNINEIPYISEAYKVGKYAFVSDYARFKILYEHGGIYFDTDVEVIKSFDDIVSKSSFMGCESNSPNIQVNPGLGIGAQKGLYIYKFILEYYKKLRFIKEDGSFNTTTIVKYVTDILKEFGLQQIDGIQKVNDVLIYPSQFFNPFDDLTGLINITPQTHSIHWYSKSWLKVSKFRTFCSRLSHRLFGNNWVSVLKNIYTSNN